MNARRLAIAIALSLSLLTGSSTFAQQKPAPGKGLRIYRVQPGDSCWSVALKFFGSGEKYTIVHRYNRLGPLPHLLAPGQELRLPISATNPDAHIGWLRRDVRARPPFAVDWRRAKQDMGLWRLYKVTTGRSSAAGIRFEDASNLRMRENALLVIYGASAQRAVRRRTIKTTVRVEEGTVVGGLASLDAPSPLRVQTPSSTVDLRSRRSQIEVDKRKTSIVSVHDGKAAVSARGASVEVKDGWGTTVKQGQRPAPPRRLPVAPSWEQSGPVVIAFAAGEAGRFEARWKAVKGARRYRVELARDAAFRFPMIDAVVGAGIKRFRAKDLELGDYYARVSAIDGWRLEGRPNQPRRFRLVQLKSSRRLERRKDESYEAVGLLRLQLPPPQRYEISVDGAPFRADNVVRLQKPGKHQVRYRLAGSRSTRELRIHLLALRAKLQGPTAALAAGDKAPLKLTLTDERGRPAAAPGLRLVAPFGEVSELRATKTLGHFAGSYTAPQRTPARRVELVARWATGPLARTMIELSVPRKPPPPKPAPQPEAWQPPAPLAGAPLLEWGAVAGVALPARDGRPRTRLGISSALGAARGSTSEDPLFLRLALRGELALWRRLGLDVDLPWFNGNLRQDDAGGNELGNLRLGARFVAGHVYGIALLPSLRLTLPTAQAEAVGQWRALAIEPALIAEWRGLGDRLTLNTNLVLPIQTDGDSTRLFLAQTLGAAYRFYRGLSAGLEFDWMVSLRDPPGTARTFPLLGALAVAYELSRARFTLSAGFGLDEDARRSHGVFSTGLTIDIFFGGL